MLLRAAGEGLDAEPLLLLPLLLPLPPETFVLEPPCSGELFPLSISLLAVRSGEFRPLPLGELLLLLLVRSVPPPGMGMGEGEAERAAAGELPELIPLE